MAILPPWIVSFGPSMMSIPIDQPGVMRVAGECQLGDRGGQVNHRGHGDAGVIVAVLAQRPAGRPADWPQAWQPAKPPK